MNIAHFIYDNQNNPWVAGGGFHRIVALYEYFPKSFTITIFCGKAHSLHDYTITDNIRVVFVGIDTKNYLLSRIGYVAHAWKKLSDTGTAYDLVIEDFSPFSPLFSFLFIPRNKLVCQIQNYFGLGNHCKKFSIFGIVSFLIEQWSLKRYSNVIYTSEDLQGLTARHVGLKPDKSTVIHNGVSEQFFTCSNVRKEKKYQLFYIGRLEIYQKGIDTLLKAVHALIKEQLPITLLIAGSGKDKNKIKNMIQKYNLQSNVFLIGRLNTIDEKIEYFTSSQITIVPSRFESWGIVSIESQACATPVVAANIPGLRQTVENQKTGILYNSFKELIESIKKILENDSFRNQLQENCRTFSKQFLWEASAQKLMHYYNTLKN